MARQTVYIKLQSRSPTPQNVDRDTYASIASHLKDAVEEYSERQGKPIRITRITIGGFTSDGLKVDYEYETQTVGPQSLELAVVIVQVLSNWKALVGLIAAIASLILLLRMLNMKMTVKVGNSRLTIDPEDEGSDDTENDDFDNGENDSEDGSDGEKKEESILPKIVGWGAVVGVLSKLLGAW